MSAASRARAFLDMVAAAAPTQPTAAAKPHNNTAGTAAAAAAPPAAAAAAESKEDRAQDAAADDDDDGFIAVGGGGAGSAGGQLSRMERRRLKKKRKQIDRGPVAVHSAPSAAAASAASAVTPSSLLSAQLSAIYRDSNACASLDLKLGSYFVNGRSTLRAADLQSLVLWALGDPARVLSPRWCFLKNKPLVQRVVLVVLDGVTEGAVLKEHAAAYEAAGCFAEFVGPTASTSGAPQPQPIRLYTNHSAFNRSSVLADYLTVPITRDREAEKALAKKQRQQQQQLQQQQEQAQNKKQKLKPQGADSDEEVEEEDQEQDADVTSALTTATATTAAAGEEEMKDEAAEQQSDSDSDDPSSSSSAAAAAGGDASASHHHHRHLHDCLITHEELVINAYPVPQTADVQQFRRSCRQPNCALHVPPTAAAASTASAAPAAAASEQAAAAPAGALLPSSGLDWESFPCVHAEHAAPAASAAVAAASSSCCTPAAAAAAAATTVAPPRFFALDCEMCYTSLGLELSRATLLDARGSILLDELVLPARPICDYNTKYSGITAEMLRGVSTSLEQVRARILEVVQEHDVLVGHSLENDLRALRILHRRCIDTALLFTHARGRPFKHSLRALVEKHLGRQIQRGSAGHDPREDAQAALELALLKTTHGKGFGEEVRRERESLGAMLHKVSDAAPLGSSGAGPAGSSFAGAGSGAPRKCMLIGSPAHLQSLLHAEPLYHAKLADTDDDAVKAAAAAIKGNQMSVVVVQLNAVRNVPVTTAAAAASASAVTVAAATPYTQALHRLRAHLSQIVAACRPNTLVIVASGQASSVTTAGQDNRQGLMWLKIKQPQPTAAEATPATAATTQATKAHKSTHAHRSAL